MPTENSVIIGKSNASILENENPPHHGTIINFNPVLSNSIGDISVSHSTGDRESTEISHEMTNQNEEKYVTLKLNDQVRPFGY